MEIDDTILTIYAQAKGWIDMYGKIDETTGEEILTKTIPATEYALREITETAKSYLARVEAKKAYDSKIDEVKKDPQIFTKY